MTTYITAQPLKLIFMMLWATFIYLIIDAGFAVDGYIVNVMGIPPPHPYPIKLVVTLIIVMLFHLAILFAIDIHVQSNWKVLIMLIVTLLFIAPFIMGMMHPPPPLVLITLWFLLSISLFLLVYLCQLLIGLYKAALS